MTTGWLEKQTAGATVAKALGRSLAVSLLTLTATGARGFDQAPDSGCQSAFRPLAGLLEPPVCHPGPVPKRPKTYPAGEPAASRRGLESPLVTLFDVHRRETLTIFPGRLPGEGLLAGFFRCRGFGEPGHLDPRLLEAALAAAAELRANRVEIVSAYRSPKFNDALSKKARRVAGESRHTRGQALDLRLEGVTAAHLGNWFWEHFDGGVGTYPRDDFVHLDVGPKRRWRGL
ncbi:MAG TPA: DUF882 domain-containing protein [Polyangia bacterium]|nr:DUF882 domain-containing protein [Polyangia bacterium]